MSPLAKFIRWHWRRRRVAAETTKSKTPHLKLLYHRLTAERFFPPPGTVDGTFTRFLIGGKTDSTPFLALTYDLHDLHGSIDEVLYLGLRG